jgi:hypothetical protein
MTYLLYFLLLLPKDSCHLKYLNEILKTPTEKDYFLTVKAKKNSRDITLVLTNVELVQNLRRNGLTLNQDIKKKILGKETILIVDDSTKYFTTVKYDEKVSEIEKKGKEYFINHYFDKWGHLKNDLPSDLPIGHIIEILFYWNVLISEPEGNLHIDKKQFCNK